MTTECACRKNSLLGLLITGLLISFGVIFNFPSMAWAHKVFIYAWYDGGTIYTESYFGAKKKVNGGLIRVYDLSGKMLLQGRTNEQGEFSFKSPQKTDLRIEVESGMGHRNECILRTEEQSNAPGIEVEDFKADETETVKMHSVSPDTEQIKALLEETLDSRLKSIKRELAAIRKEKSPGVTEIVGGIGYIIGLMGLIMYFRGRKKDE